MKKLLDARTILDLQRTVGNQHVNRLLQVQVRAPAPEGVPAVTEPERPKPRGWWALLRGFFDTSAFDHPLGISPRSGWRWQIPIAVLGIVAVGGGWIYWDSCRNASNLDATQTTEHRLGTRAVMASGDITAMTAAPIEVHVSGVVQAVYCNVGTRVKAGQSCAKIDPGPYQIIVERNEADLALVNSRLKKTKAKFAQAQAAYKRKQPQANHGTIARNALGVFRKSLEQAQAQVAHDEALVAEGEAALRAAEASLEHTDVSSPIDGTVISRNAELGQAYTVGKAAPLFLVAADLSIIQIDLHVSEKDIRAIKLGDNVSFRVDLLPGRSFKGEVTQISQAPRSSEAEASYDVVISAPNVDLLLKPGVTATITITIGKLEDVRHPK